MYKKKILFMTVALSLLLASGASANKYWNNETGDGEWMTLGNWSTSRTSHAQATELPTASAEAKQVRFGAKKWLTIEPINQYDDYCGGSSNWGTLKVFSTDFEMASKLFRCYNLELFERGEENK